MQWVLEDSELAAMALLPDGTATLRWSAARIASDAGNVGSGQGAWQPLVLTLHGAQVLEGGAPAHAMGRVREGVVKTQGQRLRSLPLPCVWPHQPVALELEMATGEWWCLQAQGLVLEVPPQACAVDALQC